MVLKTITQNGKKFVLIPEEEYRRLNAQALPPLPPVDADGTSDAIQFARASIARRLIADRRAAGLSQQELAERAGVRQETISRIESAKQTATVNVLEKLDKTIKRQLRAEKGRN